MPDECVMLSGQTHRAAMLELAAVRDAADRARSRSGLSGLARLPRARGVAVDQDTPAAPARVSESPRLQPAAAALLDWPGFWGECGLTPSALEQQFRHPRP